MSSQKAGDPNVNSDHAGPIRIGKPSIRLADRDRKSGSDVGKENRLHPRLPLVVRAEVRIDDTPQVGYLTNLSLGGAFLATERMLPIRTAIHLHVFLPWRLGEFEAEARVVWSSGKDGTKTDPPGVGLQFTALDSQADARLRAYVDTFFRLVAQIGE